MGPLTTLSIGHDNAGMTPRWMIESIYIRNEITGHVHQFPCGRWLGKGIDDDSLERLLIAQLVHHHQSHLEIGYSSQNLTKNTITDNKKPNSSSRSSCSPAVVSISEERRSKIT